LLLQKLEAAGVNPEMMKFLRSYLEPRRSTVVVAGAQSEQHVLDNSVFQGTRLGPPLWNVHFQDVALAVPPEFKETKFADDLSCSRGYDREISNEAIYNDLKDCQTSVHAWGRRNRVIFEETKEEFVILHGVEGEGEDFRALGTWMDTSLRMETNVRKMLSKARPKVTALLRSRKYYSTIEMLTQYKTHVLCLLEINPGGFYHATDTVVEQFEKVQNHFLREMGVSREEASLDFNLLPLSTRRDIGMLGLIFKSVHGRAHDDLQQLFPRKPPATHTYGTKLQSHRHSLQLCENRPGTHHALLRRSVFGLIRVWNRLPKAAVSAPSVNSF